jgi:anti-sigma B factor antagonist
VHMVQRMPRARALRMEAEPAPLPWIAVLKVSGSLDATTAQEFRAAIDELLRDGRRRIVLDLGGVEFIDSSGLGALVGSLVRARRVGGELCVARLDEELRQLLRASTLDRVLVPYTSVEEALADQW